MKPPNMGRSSSLTSDLSTTGVQYYDRPGAMTQMWTFEEPNSGAECSRENPILVL